MVPRRSRTSPLAAVLLAAVLASGCASVSFERETPTAGTFRSTAWSFTLLGFDFPSAALIVARGNASDGGHPNLVIERESLIPYLGRFDWILDILMVRRAEVAGTWGVPSE